MRATRTRARLIGAAVAAAVVLAAGSTLGLAAASGAFRSPQRAPAGQCSVPALAGRVVDVELVDMGPMMMMGRWGGGMMRVIPRTATVPAGTVSFRVVNAGSLVHELVVLPLPAGQQVGERTVGSDGRVDETASLGEASRSCGAGAGDGIDPGSVSWVTLDLGPGGYELICNLAGHYAAGMYAGLRVT